MNLIYEASNKSAKWLSTKGLFKEYETVEDQIEGLTYGFQFIFGALFKGLILTILTLLLGIFIPAIIITLTFSSLRVIAGGYHFKEYGKCLVVSLLMFIVAAYISQNTYQQWTNTNLFMLLIPTVMLGLYIIIRYVPRDTPTKIISDKGEIRKFKRWSLSYLTIWTVLMTVSITLGFKLLILSSCFGLLLELFSISKTGYNFFKKLDNQHSSN